MAMVMLGMFALNPVGITGSIIQQLNHGISTGALFLLVGVVYERRHTREISEYGGLSKVMPVYAAIFLIMTMSSIGLPTLNGFIGEFLILQGVFVASKMWAAFAGERRRARRGLHAVALPADDVRQDREPEERAPARPEPPRVRDLRAAARSWRSGSASIRRRSCAGSRRRCSTSSRASARSTTPKYARPTAIATPTPERWPRRPTPAAQFLSAVPCDAERQAARDRRRRPGPGERADAAGHLAQRFLLHPAGARAHGGRAARARRRRAAAARQHGAARVGHAAGARRDAGVARAVRATRTSRSRTA